MKNLYSAFSAVKNEKAFYAFLADLCTPTEIREMSERWNIAQLLATTQMTQKEISTKLNCAIVTVNRVARFLNDEKNAGYETALRAIFPAGSINISRPGNRPGIKRKSKDK
ncbi:MAG: trp operon repressor [Rickettsiales bacterium]|jgi:TrpR-related protein YerC/YecD|nr:trp operon repressor [Rickettsiales bacterium]